jgi:CheY-like chemotaxis protein/HPt (histidine-containing phosphotransfer) domain-containing protein
MKAPEPRILLVEDDATSRAFLAAALAALPARVAAATGAADALALAATGPPFDLWLVDAHLPDADGASLLAALRLLAPAAPALAHTAMRDPACAESLRAAGFDGVRRKPVALAVLRAAVRDALRAGADADANAAVAIAEPAAAWPATIDAPLRMATLRALFHAELPVQRAAVEDALANGDATAAAGVLHCLRASCGFVGAAALGAAVRALQADPASLDALRRFRACVDAELALAGGADG